MTGTVRPIRQQLQYVVVFTTLVALSFALIGNAVINVLLLQKVQAADLSTEADLLGRMTSPALSFDDRRLATDNLALLDLRTQVQVAGIYDSGGHLFASFKAPGQSDGPPAVLPSRGTRREDGNLVVVRQIIRDGTPLGSIYLRADQGLAAIVIKQITVALIVGALALALALVLVRRLERVVTRPISAIATAARDVVEQGDYSRRVLKYSNDEVGDMIEAFNDMLAEIERGKEELEARVLERTAALEESNRQLALTKTRADEANQAKSTFLATMSHEIRTPMNGVMGMVEVLQQTSLTGHQVEMIDLIRESAFSLLTIIDDILDFSKIEADRLEIEREPFSLAEVIEKACGLMDSLAMRRHIEFTTFVDPQIPELLLGDALRLRQVLVNLTSNAIKFSSDGERGGTVSVRATLAECGEAGAAVDVEVADNGIGIDEKTRARLFTAFSQADTSTTRRFGGTGLGLAISRQIVELMDGTITVDSESGKGAKFTVRLLLPLAPGNFGRPVPPGELDGVYCLVVGPRDGLAPDMAAYLTNAGAHVERAATPAVARTSVPSLPPGQWIWVMDGDQSPASLNALRALVRDVPGHRARYVAVGRGPRREPHAMHADLVVVDGNVMTRRRLVKAVAIAAGREFEDVDDAVAGKSRLAFTVPSREQARLDGRLILVAEDNDTNQKVILHQLALLGFAADVADNGGVALERWRTGDYALLLTDLHMPEMDGYELTAAIRAQERDARHTPILALTANALKGEADRCRAAGMDNYLSKPLRLADLKAALEAWLPDDDSHHPPVDTRLLESLVGDDPQFVAGLLEDFRKSATDIGQRLREASQRGDVLSVNALAHTLKSSARSVGAVRLGAACARLEVAGKGDDTTSVEELLPRFQAELDAVIGYLDRMRDTVPEKRHE